MAKSELRACVFFGLILVGFSGCQCINKFNGNSDDEGDGDPAGITQVQQDPLDSDDQPPGGSFLTPFKSAPMPFSLAVDDYGVMQAQWSAPEYEDSGITTLEIVVFNASQCSGDPVSVEPMNLDATSFSIDVFQADYRGILSYRLVARDGSGNQWLSDCSADIEIGSVVVAGQDDGLQFDLKGDFYALEVTGDGLDDWIFIDNDFDGARGRISVVPNGSRDPAAIRHYTGEDAGDFNHVDWQFVDITGDGIAEIIGGRNYASPGGISNAGSIYVIPTGPALPASGEVSVVARRYNGEYADDELGRIVDTSMDLDDDGINDILSVWYCASPSGLNEAGSMWIIKGSANLPPSGAVSAAGKRYDGSEAGERFGDLFGFEDINDDGLKDVITLSSGIIGNVLHILPGGAFPTSGTTTTVGFRYHGQGETTGWAYKTRILDLDKDGIKDILACDQNRDEGATVGVGDIYLLLGTDTLPASGLAGSRLINYRGEYTQHRIGCDLVEDVNGDGYADLLKTGWAYNSSAGHVMVIAGGNTWPASGDVSVVFGGRYYRYFGSSADLQVGRDLAIADVDVDAKPEIIVGAPGYNPGAAPNTGALYVIEGGAALPASGDIDTRGLKKITGDSANDYLGEYITVELDIFEDGVSDIISYSYSAAKNGANSGAWYILPGGAGEPTAGAISTVGRRYDGSPDECFGSAPTSEYDVTGDGIADLLGGSQNCNYLGVNKSGVLYVLPTHGGVLPASANIEVAGGKYWGTEQSQYFAWISSVEDLGGGSVGVLAQWPNTVYGANNYAGFTSFLELGWPLPADGPSSSLGRQIAGEYAMERFLLYEQAHPDGSKLYSRSNPGVSPGGKTAAGSVYLSDFDTTVGTAGISANAIRIDGSADNARLDSAFVDLNADGKHEMLLFEVETDADAVSLAGNLFIVRNIDAIPKGLYVPDSLPAKTRFKGTLANQLLGQSYAVGDLNQDGFDDVFLGDALGNVFAIWGRSDLSSLELELLTGSLQLDSDKLIGAIRIVDWDHDGRSDLVYGLPMASFGGTARGGIGMLPGTWFQ